MKAYLRSSGIAKSFRPAGDAEVQSQDLSRIREILIVFRGSRQKNRRGKNRIKSDQKQKFSQQQGRENQEASVFHSRV